MFNEKNLNLNSTEGSPILEEADKPEEAAEITDTTGPEDESEEVAETAGEQKQEIEVRDKATLEEIEAEIRDRVRLEEIEAEIAKTEIKGEDLKKRRMFTKEERKRIDRGMELMDEKREIEKRQKNRQKPEVMTEGGPDMEEKPPEVKPEATETPKAAAETVATEIPKAETETETGADKENSCGKCGALIRIGAKFCAKCGNKLKESSCGKCGALIGIGAKFCAKCGNKLKENNIETERKMTAETEETAEVLKDLKEVLVSLPYISKEERGEYINRFFSEIEGKDNEDRIEMISAKIMLEATKKNKQNKIK